MAYVAQLIIDVDFPEAESLEAAETTLDCWLDLIAPMLSNKIHWEEVKGTPVHEEKETE
jgi:hypothetical protein